ncbi:DUF4350 domain-containing protein [Halorientalis halophila]|uniref:DUF4350 domain-containing protein n=1 Tax=Halorientalis halophila TaxID=3108499 RepID=UPI003009AAAA
MTDLSRLVGVFVAVLALVLVVAAAAPLLASPGGEANPQPQNPDAFQPDRIVPEDVNSSGSVKVDADAEGQVVLIDRAHGNDFDREEIQPLVEALVRNGHEVRFHGGGPGGAGSAGPGSESPLNRSLREADAFVVISPDRPFADPERRGVADFADRGGRLVMLGEPTSSAPTVSSLFGPPMDQSATSQMASLSSRFGMGLGTGYLYNMYENGNNFQNVYATAAGEGPLTEGVDRVLFDRATALSVGGDASVALSAGDRSALSTTRRQGEFPVAATSGDVALIGDTSFLTPSNYRAADNEVLIGNLASFLVSGDKQPKPDPAGPQGPGVGPGPQPPRPPAVEQPPTNETIPMPPGRTPPGTTVTPAAP